MVSGTIHMWLAWKFIKSKDILCIGNLLRCSVNSSNNTTIEYKLNESWPMFVFWNWKRNNPVHYSLISTELSQNKTAL